MEKREREKVDVHPFLFFADFLPTWTLRCAAFKHNQQSHSECFSIENTILSEYFPFKCAAKLRKWAVVWINFNELIRDHLSLVHFSPISSCLDIAQIVGLSIWPHLYKSEASHICWALLGDAGGCFIALRRLGERKDSMFFLFFFFKFYSSWAQIETLKVALHSHKGKKNTYTYVYIYLTWNDNMANCFFPWLDGKWTQAEWRPSDDSSSVYCN